MQPCSYHTSSWKLLESGVTFYSPNVMTASVFNFSVPLISLRHYLLKFLSLFGFYDTLFLVPVSLSHPFLLFFIAVSSSAVCTVYVRGQGFCIWSSVYPHWSVFLPFQWLQPLQLSLTWPLSWCHTHILNCPVDIFNNVSQTFQKCPKESSLPFLSDVLLLLHNVFNKKHPSSLLTRTLKNFRCLPIATSPLYQSSKWPVSIIFKHQIYLQFISFILLPPTSFCIN